MLLKISGIAFLLSLFVLPVNASASAWARSEMLLRADLQQLADSGVLDLPVSTWPISWEAIARGLNNAEVPTSVLSVLARVEARLDEELGTEWRFDAHVSHQGNAGPVLKQFGQGPNQNIEVVIATEWMEPNVSARLEASAVGDSFSRVDFRYDGSYLNWLLFDNWAVSAEAIERWWGPGWDGSLILSDSARPVPALAVHRMNAEPSDSRLLSWLGPWRFDAFLGQLEQERHIPQAKLFGARLAFKPFPSLEIGLSRTAQFGGEGRPEDLETFLRMLVGDDNVWTHEGAEALQNEPGNQLAGYDLRWRLPQVPFALYGQEIGEDESGALPTAKLRLYGIEHWGTLSGFHYRVHAEYADTATVRSKTGFYNAQNDIGFNTAYNHHIYQSGYRYYGRSLGHSIDNDGLLRSVGGTLIDEKGDYWHFSFASGELNRDGAGLNAVSATHKSLQFAEIGKHVRTGTMEIGIGAWWQRLEEPASGASTEEQGIIGELRFSF